MAQPVMQMATNKNSATGAQNLRRTAVEAPCRMNRGLDTGARGWRFAMANRPLRASR